MTINKKNITQKKRAVSVLIIAIIFSFLLWTNKSFSQLINLPLEQGSPFIYNPFGGFVYAVVPCTCSGGAVIYVGPPVPGPYLYLPGFTRVYEYYQIPRPGVWVLGNFVPGPPCLVYAGKSCVPVPHYGVITIVGTSL